jgi:hypothetical protein
MFKDPIEMVVTGSTLYMELAGRWVKMDMAAMAGGDSAFGGTGNGFGAAGDPAAYLDYLRGAADDVKDLGTEVIGGVKTRHLQATITPERALDEAPASDRDRVRDALESSGLGDAMSTPMPVDVWVDDDGLVRRTQMTMNFGDALAGSPFGSSLAVQVDFSDFGKEVHIDAPKDAYDLTNMLTPTTAG